MLRALVGIGDSEPNPNPHKYTPPRHQAIWRRRLIDVRWPRGPCTMQASAGERPGADQRPRRGLERDGPSFHASPISQLCSRTLPEEWLPVCIDLVWAHMAAEVATASDGRQGVRCLSHERQRFSASGDRGWDSDTRTQQLASFNWILLYPGSVQLQIGITVTCKGLCMQPFIFHRSARGILPSIV